MGGGLFFIQERVGKNGKIFRMYKFRTMYPGAEKDQEKYQSLNQADGPVFKIRNDPRFTGVGKWLAKTGLDELPQIINVLKGEMTIVGPRPLPPNEEKKIPAKWRMNRRSVKPGITSSWVVSGGHRLTFREWMGLDMKNIDNKNWQHDLKIMFKTIILLTKNFFSLIGFRQSP